MAFTFIVPMTSVVEAVLNSASVSFKAQQIVREEVKKIWKRPDTDIITIVLKSPVLVPDEVAQRLGSYPDALLLINTSDQLEDRADQLIEAIKHRWNTELSLKVEIWINFFEAWGTTFFPI